MNEFIYAERHMGTDVSLSFVCNSEEMSRIWAENAFRKVHEYELRFSRFLPDSELSMLNRDGSAVVSEDFMNILSRSLELSRLTQGAFNPLLQVATRGYRQTFTRTVFDSHSTSDVPYNTDINAISIEPDTRRVTLHPLQQLDFGGILKGFLAQDIADEVMRTSDGMCRGCIINLGGDITTRGRDVTHEPFIFEIYDPVAGIDIPVALTDISLATSGTYARKWRTEDGTIEHHIIDNRTQRNPENSIVSVSIVARDGSLAEALTKLVLTRGLDEAMQIVPPSQFPYQHLVISNTGVITSTIL